MSLRLLTIGQKKQDPNFHNQEIEVCCHQVFHHHPLQLCHKNDPEVRGDKTVTTVTRVLQTRRLTIMSGLSTGGNQDKAILELPLLPRVSQTLDLYTEQNQWSQRNQ